MNPNLLAITFALLFLIAQIVKLYLQQSLAQGTFLESALGATFFCASIRPIAFALAGKGYVPMMNRHTTVRIARRDADPGLYAMTFMGSFIVSLAVVVLAFVFPTADLSQAEWE